MTRQQRQKQLLTRVLIAVAVLVIAITVVVVRVRAGYRADQGAVSSETAAAAQNTESAQVSQETADMQTDEAAQPAGDEQNTEAAQPAADGQSTETAQPAAQESDSEEAGSTPASGTVTVGTQTPPAASAAVEEPEEEAKGSSLGDQSLVEKLSVDARKNLEAEKIRLAEEAEERQRQAEEEARKAEVKDRAELSALPMDELVEYLRNKEVPEELIEFMVEYPEAREFVTDYLYQPETPPSKDISGEVEKGQFPHFLQWDKRWGYENYGGSFFAVAGCGPTAMSVVYSGLTGNTDMNPYVMSQWAEDQGYYIVGEGTSWEMMWSGANQLGLYAWEVDADEMSIVSTLRNGFPIIAAMSPGGDFTNFGHFIVLTDVDEEGNISIRDSNSIERTERTWTADELIWQMAGLWAYNYDTYY